MCSVFHHSILILASMFRRSGGHSMLHAHCEDLNSFWITSIETKDSLPMYGHVKDIKHHPQQEWCHIVKKKKKKNLGLERLRKPSVASWRICPNSRSAQRRSPYVWPRRSLRRRTSHGERPDAACFEFQLISLHCF